MVKHKIIIISSLEVVTRSTKLTLLSEKIRYLDDATRYHVPLVSPSICDAIVEHDCQVKRAVSRVSEIRKATSTLR